MSVQPSSLAVAKIIRPHGVKGLVRLRPLVDDLNLISDPAGCFCDRNGATVHIVLKNAAPPDYLAEISGITDRTAAALWTGAMLTIPRDRLPAATEEDGLLLNDRIGMSVQDTDGQPVGIVIAIHNFGASDLLEIRPENAKSFYLPITSDFVLETDAATRCIVITNYDVFLG
ncbi:MAG: ribosome maturation factor RimM [Pseudomonadota bacterium]